MQRISITIDDDLLHTVDQLMERRGYDSRSEAFRELIRAHATADSLTSPDTSCVATLTHVFDHGTRELAQRVGEAHHARHNLIIASTQVYLDHDSCLGVSVLRGEAGEVKDFAQSLVTQRGVRHSNLHLIPVKVEVTRHDHGLGPKTHEHLHA
jgi:CopG family nickel-responsive transcriptional regulator